MTPHTQRAVDAVETLTYSIPKMDDRSFHAFMEMATCHEWWIGVECEVVDGVLSYWLNGYGVDYDYEVVSGWVDASDLYRAALKIATSYESSDVISRFALTGSQDYVDMYSADAILQVAFYGSVLFG